MRTRGYILIGVGLLIGILGVSANTTDIDPITGVWIRQLFYAAGGFLLLTAGGYWAFSRAQH
jgi:hypothetical protein